MQARLFSKLIRFSVSAVFCLATAAATRAAEPQWTGLPAVPLAANQFAGPQCLPCNPPLPVCCEPCERSEPCDRPPRFYFTGEYMMWWFQGSPQPVPLVTSVPAALIPPGGITPGGFSVGSLPDANATVVLGGQDLDTGLRPGARFTLGTWLDDNQSLGFEGNYFFTTRTTITQSVAATGAADSPLLSIPFFDVTGALTPTGLPGETARPIPTPPILTFRFPATIPGESAGVFTQQLESRLQGFELNALVGLSPMVTLGGFRLEAVGGFRYLNLRESLAFSSAVNLGPLGFSDVIYHTLDAFTARNDFYGGQLGLRGEYRWGRIVVQTTAKIALGDVSQRVAIDGATVTNMINGPGTPPLHYAGGIFAQPSNSGTHGRDRFAVLPQADVNLGYQMFSWARVFVGYSFLYLSEVVRPGNQIDRGLNATRIPFNTDPGGSALVPTGPEKPAPAFHGSGFWAQGINFGVDLRY